MDSANLDRLGKLYENNKDKIDKTYKINIDHHISNTNFGDINIVDGTSPATAQILYEVLKILDKHPMAQMNTLKS
jgi:phosphoesterase RecJ-like protein